MAAAVDELRLRIVLENPPEGVDFGIQQGSGPAFTTVQKQRSKGADLEFEFTIGVLAGDRGAVPDFRGPIVQGPRGGRFVYLDIGTYAGQSNTPWGRRLKVPLAGITSKMIEGTKAGGVLETRVPGTGRDGGPTSGTVKPFGGWQPAS